RAFPPPRVVDDGVSPTLGNYDATVDSSGDLLLAYVVTSTDNRSENVRYARITPGGIPIKTGITRHAAPPGATYTAPYRATEPSIAVDRLGRVHVAWGIPRAHPDGHSLPNEILYSRSEDRGRSFTAPLNLSNSPPSHSYYPRIATGAGETPYFVWGENATECTPDSVRCYLSGALVFRAGAPRVRVVDPNPELLEEGRAGSIRLRHDLPGAAALHTYRSGTTADGTSQLLLLIESDRALRVSIEGRAEADLADGALEVYGIESARKASLLAPPQSAGEGKSVVALLYTPPDAFGAYPGGQREIPFRIAPADDPSAEGVTLSLTLARPPVVLVHGLWSRPQVWIDGKFKEALENQGFYVALADYEAANAASFDPLSNNQPGINAVEVAVREALEHYRFNQSLAASQADVVGHSMGGLMTRGLIRQPDYQQRSNFGRGWVHRLITVGTPHYGSPHATLMYDLRDTPILFPGSRVVTLNDLSTHLLNQPLDQGAIEALRPGSDAYKHLGEARVPAHAVVGTWETNAGGSLNAMQFLLDLLTQGATDLTALFGEASHDLIVGATSQYGGLPRNGTTATLYRDTVHSDSVKFLGDTAEPASAAIQEKVIALLSSAKPEEFADGFPAPLLEAKSRSPRPFKPLQDPPVGEKGIRITHPATGSEVPYGSRVEVAVSPTGGAVLKKGILLIEGKGLLPLPSAPPHTVGFALPQGTAPGQLNLVALAQDETGAILGDAVPVQVKMTSPPKWIEAEPEEVILTATRPARRLRVMGNYGAWVDLTPASAGTRYAARRGEEIVQVGENGLLTAVKSGTDVIEITHGDRLALITVTVRLPTSGDVNQDGAVNVADAVLALRAIVGLAQLTEEQRSAADLLPDGQINVGDVVMILRLALGLGRAD
ncbi:MAG: hypothetical protein KY468_04490, partial [Armatimonadetes bacterium]|nr:hypothetical protein [Armatimonadota bacterium]